MNNNRSKSKLGPHVSKTQNISEIKQKVFVLLLIKHSTFLGAPCISHELNFVRVWINEDGNKRNSNINNGVLSSLLKIFLTIKPGEYTLPLETFVML